jgi:hypothetical protein
MANGLGLRSPLGADAASVVVLHHHDIAGPRDHQEEADRLPPLPGEVIEASDPVHRAAKFDVRAVVRAGPIPIGATS